MIYFAILLVLLGVFCFIYVFSRSRGGERNTRKANKINAKKKYEHTNQYTLFNLRYPEYKESSEYEAKIRIERNFGKQWIRIEPENVRDISNTAAILEEKVIPFTATIPNDSQKEYKTQEHIKIIDVGFSISGVLFLDYGKKISYENKNLKETDWMEENFLSLKRIGPAVMKEKDGNFSFSLNDSQVYEYHVHSIEQIVFLDGAFSFIPTEPSLPIPIFFTDSLEKFKKFLAGNR